MHYTEVRYSLLHYLLLIAIMKKWHTMECHPQEALLATSSGLQDNVGELSIAEDEGLSEEWVRVCAEHFFPTEGSGSQDIVLDVSEPQRTQLQQILSSYPGVLAKTPGRTTVAQHFINVGDAAPVQQWPYRVPYSQRELVKQELDRMLQAKVIRPSTSPWAAPIVLVTKKDGEVRFCVDYRKLNKLSRFDAYPMPRIEELIDTLGQAKVISIP